MAIDNKRSYVWLIDSTQKRNATLTNNNKTLIKSDSRMEWGGGQSSFSHTKLLISLELIKYCASQTRTVKHKCCVWWVHEPIIIYRSICRRNHIFEVNLRFQNEINYSSFRHYFGRSGEFWDGSPHLSQSMWANKMKENWKWSAMSVIIISESHKME